jgi:hypothetical protein
MASISSVTSVQSGLTTSSGLQALQASAGTTVIDPQPTASPIVVDIYDGKTAANQAALVSYLEAAHLYRPNSLTGDPTAAVATIDDGSGNLQTAGSEIASGTSADGVSNLLSASWSTTAADHDVISSAQLSAVADYAITITHDDAGGASATVVNADGSTVTSAPGAASLTDGDLHITFDAHGGFAVAFSESAGGSTETLNASVGYGNDAVAAVVPSAAPGAPVPAGAATIHTSTTTILNAQPFVPTKSTPLLSSVSERHATATATRNPNGDLELTFFVTAYHAKTYATPSNGQSGNAVSTIDEAIISYAKTLAVAPAANINAAA